MKNGRMQAKDVPDRPVLEFIHMVQTEGVLPPLFQREQDAEERWHHVTWFEYDDQVPPNSVRLAMPAGTPDKVVLAKMRRLIDRGLVDGCPCGCRGDYELTDAGRAMIGKAPIELGRGRIVFDSDITPLVIAMLPPPTAAMPPASPETLFAAFSAGHYLAAAFRQMFLAGETFIERPARRAGEKMFELRVLDQIEAAGIVIEDRPDGVTLHLPNSAGSIDGLPFQQLLNGDGLTSADFPFFRGDGGSFERPPWKAERGPPPPQSYLAHDPTKNVRRRRRK